MCWRDSLSPRARLEEFEGNMARIREANTLRRVNAYKRCEVIPSTQLGETRRRYFRRRYWRTLSGPTNTIEIVLRDGIVVMFTNLPEDIWRGFGLRPPNGSEKEPEGKWRAKVVEVEGQFGFSFGRTGSKLYFPLDSEEDLFRFSILSIPRAQPQSS